MLEIRFDDPSTLASTILRDDFQYEPYSFWDEWEKQFVLIDHSRTDENLLKIKHYFQCARNICSKGMHYQNSAMYFFIFYI